MTTPSSGYATLDDISRDVLSNGDRVHGSDPRSKPIEGKVLGQEISDVIESLIGNIPKSEEGGGLDTVDMDVDSPLNDNGSPEAGPGPSTAAFREANRHLYSDGSLDMNGRFSDGESDDLGPVDEGGQKDDEDEGEEGGGEEDEKKEEEEEDESDSQQEQLDEVLKVDRGFYDVLVHDLKECIDEAAWTLDLWKRVFVHEYGWSPEPLLDKYGALIEAAVPAFTAKLDRKVPVTTGQLELPTSAAFAQVYQELKAWDWDNPTTRKIDFLHNYKQKYGVMANHVLRKYSGLLKQLLPRYAARMNANIRKTIQNPTSSQMGSKPANRETQESARETQESARETQESAREAQESTNGPALERKVNGVSSNNLQLFHLLVDDLRARDWSKPGFTQRAWVIDLRKVLGEDQVHRAKIIMGMHAPQLRRMVPEYANQMDFNRYHGKARPPPRAGPVNSSASSIARASPPRSSSSSPKAPRRPRPIVRLPGVQATARTLDSAANKVSNAPYARPLERERTPRPRHPSYVMLPRRDGPLSFPSALAELDVEVYRHQSANHTVLPQLAVFSDYLTSQAGSQYKALVTRIRDLGPAIESQLDDMRVVAKDVDRLQAAVRTEWAAFQVSGAMADVVMDVDGERAGRQAWEYKQAAAVARRSVLLGHRAELDRMREERVKCLAKVRRIDEVVVAARAKIEAALMEE
ncbi:hypothetical protein CcaverHIS002_0410340 [Cutaneotrichosporon cavernicola]|uniref:Uncharacterized protein n=1 Tax=Cutaneotrichosporon cavernicola TaxID=279322 RepID=A0AA48QW92_9TREE|nr:uncharacterized protein CcaverHIS019_0410240 [Cutaneotrichosporon cavernicola]BEI84430.1 hypothetical protein CcaverHIS002_0410340 [Cutaneotrichosporon cavernicola]BEI92204.1 hypothetical protein CcaverHIS019_0410240 [Cutaneotrichosporon cavernicola]BEI99975.1 hypothetical protein CcaverHIS631_0410180 [Cutaneotrichosporon cavernicola]BEJ07748.1 hypothetical protein CcaverHIS641_0410170 [Cutaneotrichosporon cavernicola]